MEEFTFVGSSEVEYNVNVKISSLESYASPIARSKLLQNPELRYIGSNLSPFSDLFVTVQVWGDSKPLSVVQQTAYKAFSKSRTWNEWLELSVPISILPLSAQLAITVWDCAPNSQKRDGHVAIPFGGVTLPLFDDKGMLRKGRQKCKLHLGKEADPFSDTTTPADRAKRRGRTKVPVEKPTDLEAELDRLEIAFKRHESGEIPKSDWLDKLVFDQVKQMQQEAHKAQKLRRQARTKDLDAKVQSAANDSDEQSDKDEDDSATLIIDLPRFEIPIVFTDFEYEPTPISSLSTHLSQSINLRPPPEVQSGPGILPQDTGPSDGKGPPLIQIYDPEVGIKENPVESKHRRLVRSHRTGILDRDLKPNAKIRDELNTIMTYGPTQELNGDEKDLIWKFRHHLTREKRAMTKFIKSVNWKESNEARQAIHILPKWTQIDVDDALELLGPNFDHPAVRAYAVNRLRKADDEELLLYLLQLVQALKFEIVSDGQEPISSDSALAPFLIQRACESFLLGNYLFWYLMVEHDDKSAASRHTMLYGKVAHDYMTQLVAMPGGVEQRKLLLRQAEFIKKLRDVSLNLQKMGAYNRPRMVEYLKKYLADPKNEMLTFDPPLPLPLDPTVKIVGTYAEETKIFKSSLTPMLLHFNTTESTRYPFLFKRGDDLRQDQLVLQIISLMDRLLRKENLDLKLSPYRILATSPDAGAVQFIPSISLQAAKNKSANYVLEYLRANSPDKNAEYGIRPEVMDNYVKSCAGYCVVTYILGVGDRHLDNLLLTPDGHFFHADFGYILGRDPKPAPPPIKITMAMVDGMGGLKSSHFEDFRGYCATAYIALRKSSSLILNLFALMRDANIPDIRAEPDKVVDKVKERFALGLSEEEAIREFEAIVLDSLGRMMPYIIDLAHDWMQRYTR